jgi:hypothetical protein
LIFDDFKFGGEAFRADLQQERPLSERLHETFAPRGGQTRVFLKARQ